MVLQAPRLTLPAQPHWAVTVGDVASRLTHRVLPGDGRMTRMEVGDWMQADCVSARRALLMQPHYFLRVFRHALGLLAPFAAQGLAV